MSGVSPPGQLHAAEAAGAAGGTSADLEDTEDSDADVVRISRHRRPIDGRLALISAILLVAVAQVLVSWFLLSSLNQLRDQTTAANGLQRCMLSAQINATDANTYRTAIQGCLKR